jgi:hypothetical protein
MRIWLNKTDTVVSDNKTRRPYNWLEVLPVKILKRYYSVQHITLPFKLCTPNIRGNYGVYIFRLIAIHFYAKKNTTHQFTKLGNLHSTTKFYEVTCCLQHTIFFTSYKSMS